MAHKAVGVNSSFTIADGTSVRGVVKTAHKTDTLRIFAKGNGAHVAIGTLPTAANTNYYVGAGNPKHFQSENHNFKELLVSLLERQRQLIFQKERVHLLL